MSFLQAGAVQWVNPKAWAMALASLAACATLGPVAVAMVFVFGNLPSAEVWAAMGQGMGFRLGEPLRLRIFHMTMAVLLVGSMPPALAGLA